MERSSKNQREYGRLHRKSAIFALLIALCVVALLLGVLLQGTQIADEGMAPTLRAGDVVLFSRFGKYLHAPMRGDVYAFLSGGRLSLGRVIALPGERVAIDDGNVYIDGIFLSESAYVQHADAQMEEIELQEGEYFLLPDCRVYMELSAQKMRVNASELRGRAFLRVAPFERAGFFS